MEDHSDHHKRIQAFVNSCLDESLVSGGLKSSATDVTTHMSDAGGTGNPTETLLEIDSTTHPTKKR